MSRFYNSGQEIKAAAQVLRYRLLEEEEMVKKTGVISKLSVAILVLGMSFTALAQGPIQKRVDFSINVPYTLRMGEYLLPAGNYVLHQVLQNDLNLFALHPGNLTHKPIALIRTTRIDYNATGYPGKTALLIDTENNGAPYARLEGWNIPGLDGYEIISVVEKHKGTLIYAKNSAYRYKD